MIASSIDEYNELVSVKLPFKCRTGRVIEKLEGMCPSCGGGLTGLKCKIGDWENSTEIEVVGVCHACRIVSNCRKVRWYADGRFTWLDNGVWMSKVKMSLTERIWNILNMDITKWRSR